MAKMDLNGDDEKVNTEMIFWSAMSILSEDDKKLPQVFLLLFLIQLFDTFIPEVLTYTTMSFFVGIRSLFLGCSFIEKYK